MVRVAKLNGAESPLEVGKKINEIIEHGVGGGHSLFDIVMKDHVLTYEESEGLTLLGDYAYKNEVENEYHGSPYLYERCVSEYEEAEETTVMTSRNFEVIGTPLIREDYETKTSFASNFSTENFIFYKYQNGSDAKRISFKFKTGDDITTQQTLVSGGAYHFSIGIKSSKLVYYYSTNGTSWNRVNGSSGLGLGTLKTNTWYDISIELNYSLETYINGFLDLMLQPVATTFSKEHLYIGVYNSVTEGFSYKYPFLGELDLTSYRNDTITGKAVPFYNYADVKKHANGHVYYDVNTDAAEEIDKLYANTGMAWLYGIDLENERIKIPRNDWYFMNGNTSNVGRMTPAGIPDIDFSMGGIEYSEVQSQYWSTQWKAIKANCTSGTSNNTDDDYMNFKQSRSNSVYGNSDTVQTNAVKLITYMVTGKTFDDISGSGSGTTGGITDFNLLENKPAINNITIMGNLSLDDLGIQPKGEYLTSDSIDLSTKADVATTLEGYGIEDAYTKNEVYNKFEIDVMLGDINTVLDTINGEEV